MGRVLKVSTLYTWEIHPGAMVLAQIHRLRAVIRLGLRPSNHIPVSLLRRGSFLCSSAWMQPPGDGPSVFLVLSIATGLPIFLWTYKCIMVVLFQRKIIYMGYLPPGARTEELSSVTISKGISCEEVKISTTKGPGLSGIVMSHESSNVAPKPPTVLFYLQGNAGNPLHRIPVFEKLLSSSHSMQIISIAPRSYWKSYPRSPSEHGILSDYHYALRYTISRWPTSPIVLYGHSLGGSVAVCLASILRGNDYPNVKGLILENPFASIPQMVTALYPQRWLPYHYLTPFVWDTWDGVRAMKTMTSDSLLFRLSKDMLLLMSEKDELVPNLMGSLLFDVVDGDGSRKKVMIRDALHENAWQQKQWLTEMNEYTRNVS